MVAEKLTEIGPQKQQLLNFAIENPGSGKHMIRLVMFDAKRDYESFSSKAQPYELFFRVNIE